MRNVVIQVFRSQLIVSVAAPLSVPLTMDICPLTINEVRSREVVAKARWNRNQSTLGGMCEVLTVPNINFELSLCG
jgi:hypothetical protein